MVLGKASYLTGALWTAWISLEFQFLTSCEWQSVFILQPDFINC